MSKKSIKDLFDVAQSHGPNYVDDNPRIKAGASFASKEDLTFMSQNRISFSSVLKAKGAEQSAN